VSVTAVSRITTPAVPELPAATWTNAFRIGEEIVMSGMTAHPAAKQAALGAYEQTLEVLRKLLAYVEAAGGNVRNIYKLVIYVTDIAEKDEVGRARRDFFQAPYPCSTLVEVKGLVFPELKVEIDAWARLDVDLSRCA
jgi:2-iminobutanoate/2-iminopropanoate deaminase